MLQISFGQDGDIIDKEIANEFPLLLGDTKYSKLKKDNIFDFVGFVINKEKLLAVFPKHYFDTRNADSEKSNEDIKLLFNVIFKYINKTTANADKYIGYDENFESDYPFSAFFKIYEYYKKYGIYNEEQKVIQQNANGKISWKDTIQKSNVIVSNGNLLYLPLFSKKTSNQNVFISECMIFVINYTIKNFGFFLEMSPVKEKESKIDFLANREYTLSQLYQYKNTLFKDYQKELINSLICFFENYNKKANGGAIHFKIRYFNLIWEDMVNKYLNECFVEVNEEKYEIIFDNNRNGKLNKFNKKSFPIDKSKHKFIIEPDHYYESENDMYIFDSKYYVDMSYLNYKQFAYTILLGNSELCYNKNLYSAMLLPGNSNNGLHLKLDRPYCQMKKGCNYIIEQFLNVKLLMKNYMDLDIYDELNEEKYTASDEYIYGENESDYQSEQLMVAEEEEEYRYE